MQDLSQVDAVTRMQTYIENHIGQEITLRMLARQAGYSPWHCARIFKEYTGYTPFEYIRKMRLSKAALALRDEGRKVVDVAMDFVFDSHEGFTRAFHKQFGLRPKAYQKETPPIGLFTPYPVRGRYMMDKVDPDLSPLSDCCHVRIMRFPARKMILLRGRSAENYIAYTQEVGCDVWGVLVSIKDALYEPVGMWLPNHLRPKNTSKYAQGVEVSADYSGIIPKGYDVIDLPSCTMMMFQGDPYDEDRFCEAINGLSERIAAYNPMTDGYVWAKDDAPRIQLEPQGYRGYIEARPVRAIK